MPSIFFCKRKSKTDIPTPVITSKIKDKNYYSPHFHLCRTVGEQLSSFLIIPKKGNSPWSTPCRCFLTDLYKKVKKHKGKKHSSQNGGLFLWFDIFIAPWLHNFKARMCLFFFFFQKLLLRFCIRNFFLLRFTSLFLSRRSITEGNLFPAPSH